MLERDPAYLPAHLEMAEALRLEGRFEEALSHLDLVLAEQPSFPWAVGTRGQVLVGLGVSTRRPWRSRARSASTRRFAGRGSTWPTSGRTRPASGCRRGVRRCACSRGRSRQHARLKADALRKLGDYESQVEVLNELLEESPKDAAVLAGRGLALRMTSRNAEAIASFEAALAAAPGQT